MSTRGMRADLRLADLEANGNRATKLMNVKIPDTLAEAIDAAAAELGCSKMAVVIALLNEGLDEFQDHRSDFPATAPEGRARRGRPPLPATAA